MAVVCARQIWVCAFQPVKLRYVSIFETVRYIDDSHLPHVINQLTMWFTWEIITVWWAQVSQVDFGGKPPCGQYTGVFIRRALHSWCVRREVKPKPRALSVATPRLVSCQYDFRPVQAGRRHRAVRGQTLDGLTLYRKCFSHRWIPMVIMALGMNFAASWHYYEAWHQNAVQRVVFTRCHLETI